MIIIDSFKVSLTKSVHCQRDNIMYYIMLETARTYATFSIVAMYRQCVSFHARSF